MASRGEINGDIGGSIHRLNAQLDTALERTVDLHRAGGNEEAVLAETAVAVGAAKALEILTGESWENQLERKEEGKVAAPVASNASQPRRWRRRGKPARR